MTDLQEFFDVKKLDEFKDPKANFSEFEFN